MTESNPDPDIVFEKVLEDLGDDAFRKNGKLDRLQVDELYMRRDITPDQAVAIEKALQTEGVEIIEESSDSIPLTELEVQGPQSTALDYIASYARKYQFLDAREEVECGEAIQTALELRNKDSSRNDALAERIFARAQAAKSKLVTRNIRLVLKVAFNSGFRNRSDTEDLVQLGLIGLLRAAEKFDPNWGTRFSTYAVWWIRQAMHRGIADQSSLIRIPVHMQAKIAKYRRARRMLRLKDTYSGKQIRPIAEYLAWTEEYTAKIAELAEQQIISLDAPVNSSGEMKVKDQLSDVGPKPDEVYMQREKVRIVNDVVEQLGDKRLTDIIKKRFGLYGSTETLEKIGDDYGLTRERIRQLEVKALQMLRHPSRSKRLRDL